ncbi:MAG: LysM peptidoglycan-binding domain-containing protein [Saprospiraceae bacterium]|nr:LysM peptidoglycan-binding domain-containing protein [Saprospiraceae bacterium]
MNYYYLHELEAQPLQDEYLYTATIKVYEKIDLKKLAEDFEIEWEVMRRLNPAFTKGFIPKSKGEYTLTLPETKLYDFALANDALDKIVGFSPASVKRQSEIIALVESNQRREDIASSTSPLGNLPFQMLNLGYSTEAIRLEDETNIKVVKLTKGKSLSDIARENGVELASLIEFNKIDELYPPKIGDQIRIKM